MFHGVDLTIRYEISSRYAKYIPEKCFGAFVPILTASLKKMLLYQVITGLCLTRRIRSGKLHDWKRYRNGSCRQCNHWRG